MTRTTFSARTLAQQILQRWPDAKITNPDEPDGLGIHRQLQIEQPEAVEIFDVLVPIAQHDRRILTLDLRDGGPLTVTFSSDSKVVDVHTKFPIDEVAEIQKGDEAGEVAASGPDSPAADPESAKPAKRATAAKKASASKDGE